MPELLTIAKPTRREFPQGRFEAVDVWHAPAVIAENNFVHKSLSNWSFNIAVGCSHACRFCYVPSAATIKQGPKLREYGVEDPIWSGASTCCCGRGTKTNSSARFVLRKKPQ